MSAVTPRLATLGVLLVAVLIFVWPLVVTNALPGGSDIIFAYHSAHGFSQALAEGVFYPRWIDNSNHQFGGPTFIFYSPLPYYAVALAHTITPDLPAAFRVVIFLVSFLSGWTLYLAARPISTRTGATLAAALYVLIPYHSLDLYDRFAFAEFCSFIWFPLIILGLRRVLLEKRHDAWPFLAACLTGLLFTHLVTAFMGIFVMGPYALFMAYRQRDWRGLAFVSLAAVVASLAAAVYLIPMMHQRPLVHLEWVVDAPYGDWRRNFVYRDEVAFGYKLALIKPWVDRVATSQVLLTVAAAALFFFGLRRQDSGAGSPGTAARLQAGSLLARDPVHQPVLQTEEGYALVLLGAWTFFLQIPLSSFIWATVPQLGTVQFPWRFGLFQGLITVLLVACAMGCIRTGPSAGILAGWRMAALLTLAAVPSLVVSLLLIHNPARPIIFDAVQAGRPAYLSRVMTEYLPRDMVGWKEFVEIALPDVPAAQLDGEGTVEVVSWTTHRRILKVKAPAEVRLALRTFYHPGWVMRLDQQPLPVDFENPMHVITAVIPAGEHTVEVEFTATGDRRLGAALSLVGLATIGVFAGYRGYQRFHRLRS
jgi:hypothetical protein